MEILKVDRHVRETFGLPKRGAGMVQPWARRREGRKERGRLELLYTFTVKRLPAGPLSLAIEQPQRFEAQLNGRRIPWEQACGWWADTAFTVVPLDPAALMTGRNELVLAARMSDDLDLEPLYLLGDFSVAVRGSAVSIAGRAPEPRFGDWTRQGLPFYGGSVMFRTRVAVRRADDERVFVEVPRFAGACARITVDGRDAGVIGWPPCEADITPLVNSSRSVELGVEVFSHRRNCFGPLHNAQAEVYGIGPGQFTTEGDEWSDSYRFVPCGLLAAPRLSIRRMAPADP